MDRGDSVLAAVASLRSRAIDPAVLSEAARVDALVALQQLHAWTEAQEARLLAAMDTGSEVDRDLAATEIGVALRQPRSRCMTGCGPRTTCSIGSRTRWRCSRPGRSATGTRTR